MKRVQEAFRYHDSVMVQMPTGTGKTMVLANIVFSFLEKSNHPIWIVAHRRELVEQIKETIFSKITPSLFTLKEGNFSKTHLSSLTLKGGSTAFPKPLFSLRRLAALGKVQASLLCTHLHNLSPQGTGDVTAPTRRSEPLRSKVGGASKVSPDCAGWDRLAATCLRSAEGLGERLAATSASSVNPDSDMMPIKAMSIQWLSKHYILIHHL